MDQDTTRYTVELLRRWKADAEEEANRKLGRPQVAGEDPAKETASSAEDDCSAVEDFLVKHRKLLTQSRGYILAQVIRLSGLTSLAAWRRAQVNGMLREFKQVSDARSALWSNPETMMLLGSVGKLADCFEGLSLDPTQEDLRLQAEWEKWPELTRQLGSHGPQNDAQVQAWQQASLTFLDASLTVHAVKERTLEDAVKKWRAVRNARVSGGMVTGPARTS